jgi:hypothetical protein
LRFKDDDHNNSSQEGDYEDGVAGINEEVIGFVKEISLRPEYWVDFPLPLQNGKNKNKNKKFSLPFFFFFLPVSSE